MNQQLEVYPYSIDKLREIIAEKSGKNSPDTIAAKLHHQYFHGYCDDIGARTIVVENRYVDQHYLEDYAAYYVRCFEWYDRVCTRLHLFREAISNDDISSYLRGESDGFDRKLQEAYLGFVIIKPLPRTVIGRTCLRTYPSHPDSTRHFPSVRDYEANLFGTKLIVKSLAFQEQDRVVAACATSALWSVFQGTGKEFQHVIPSPVQITQAATEKLPIETRVLPSRGLSTAMMAHAIRHVGLEPVLVKAEDTYIMTGTIYAYLKGRIPMILGIELWDTSVTPNEFKGFHAIAVTGYNLGKGSVTPFGMAGFQLAASRIDKIYVHDDQVGPFARMSLDGGLISVGTNNLGAPIEVESLSTSWVGANGQLGSMRARPTILLVPVYHKIRIPFERIHDTVLSFDLFFGTLIPVSPKPFHERLEWEIFLTSNNDIKSDVRDEAILKGTYLHDFLLEGMPRFLWRARAFFGGVPVLDLIFDGTDIEQGMFFLRSLEYDEDLSIFLRVMCRAKAAETLLKGLVNIKPDQQIIVKQIIDWFKGQPVEGLNDDPASA